MAELADLDIEFVLGEHPMKLLEDSDVLAVSGGVPIDMPLVRAARQQRYPPDERFAGVHQENAGDCDRHHGLGREDDNDGPDRGHGPDVRPAHLGGRKHRPAADRRSGKHDL